MKKQCNKCSRILSILEFYKNKMGKNGLSSQCKECQCKHQKEKLILLKRETMNAFGSQCVHVDENGVQCSRNSIDDLDKLTLSHPNGDGDEHRNLISNGHKGLRFYQALQKLGYNTGKFVIRAMCRDHHNILDRSGKKHYRYKQGKFDDPIWLRKRYIDDKMTIKEIATLCGVSEGTVRNRLIKFNISRRKRGSRP